MFGLNKAPKLFDTSIKLGQQSLFLFQSSAAVRQDAQLE
jgi:hypothetical protein